MSILKRISILLILLLITTPVYANFAIFDAEEYDVTIKNIKENITKIELLKYYQETDFNKVFNNTFDPTFDTQFAGSAVKTEEVDPYTKDDYVENTNYDKTKYIVNVSYSFVYTISHDDSNLEYHLFEKVTSIDELKNAIKNHKYGGSGTYNLDLDMDKFNSKLENYIDTGKITCKRSIEYTVKVVDLVKSLSTDLIKNNKLELNLTDFSPLNELGKELKMSAGFVIRFYNDKDEFKDIMIGNQTIIQDSHIKTKPKVKKSTFDYVNTESGVEPSNRQVNTFTSVLNRNLVKILIALVITLVVELIIAIIMKLKSYILIGATNIITQLIFHACTIAFMTLSPGNVPILYYIIAETLIVLIEFGIYALFKKDISKKKLFIYSLIANMASFGLSLILNFM